MYIYATIAAVLKLIQKVPNSKQGARLSDTFVLTIGPGGTAHAGGTRLGYELEDDEFVSPVFEPMRGHDLEDSEFRSPVFDPYKLRIYQANFWDISKHEEHLLQGWGHKRPQRPTKARK